ncbi:SirB1 family protein [Arenibaculum pallidiluteum]|uniref:SirB1 family protein n=1 Tax=Arenibaculum pallidiluteum TaxID=2812559 RepID=UPI001A9674DC|nr:tetratricopeptide repeat protein [Arenibaculum pallidiluteum]
MTTRQQAQDLLRRIGTQPDEAIDLAEAALALAVLERPDADAEVCRRHLAELAEAVGAEAGDAPALEARTGALRTVLVERYGYRGDQLTYDDIRNANLISVVERRKGLPVAIGILFIHAARAQGWEVEGLNFPGHFLIRLEAMGERAIIDPFDEGRPRGPHELRDLLKVAAGLDAELTPEHYQPVGNRDILLRLQNNLKLRFMKGERVDKAAEIVDGMLLFAPDEPTLWREAGLLHAHAGNLDAAVTALETFIALSQNETLKHQTALLLQQLRSKLN